MSLYKVEFKNNTAIGGKLLPVGFYDHLKEFGLEGSKQYIKWYIVDADSEVRAVEMANKMVRQIWGGILGLT